jgi:hypothetical protein
VQRRDAHVAQRRGEPGEHAHADPAVGVDGDAAVAAGPAQLARAAALLPDTAADLAHPVHAHAGHAEVDQVGAGLLDALPRQDVHEFTLVMSGKAGAVPVLDVWSTQAASVIGNVIWIVVAGIWLAIGHVVTGIALCATIIGIPLGIANFKLIPVSLVPLGKVIVPLP